MCPVTTMVVMAGLGAMSSYLSIQGQNEQADAHNRALETQSVQVREAQKNNLNAQFNKQQSINDQSVAKKFMAERQNLRELGMIRARNAQALGVSNLRQQSASENSSAIDLSILNANRDTALTDVQANIRTSNLSTTNRLTGLQSQGQTGVSGLQAGLGILMGGISGATGGAQFNRNMGNV